MAGQLKGELADIMGRSTLLFSGAFATEKQFRHADATGQQADQPSCMCALPPLTGFILTIGGRSPE